MAAAGAAADAAARAAGVEAAGVGLKADADLEAAADGAGIEEAAAELACKAFAVATATLGDEAAAFSLARSSRKASRQRCRNLFEAPNAAGNFWVASFKTLGSNVRLRSFALTGKVSKASTIFSRACKSDTFFSSFTSLAASVRACACSETPLSWACFRSPSRGEHFFLANRKAAFFLLDSHFPSCPWRSFESCAKRFRVCSVTLRNTIGRAATLRRAISQTEPCGRTFAQD
mmetsp:Transcript_90652/g.259260  ORF Transcript_90652/g.259260 Transcript_90652/m.259260 type:complete len:232 (+) Transcript_90652:332-1027(+)